MEYSTIPGIEKKISQLVQGCIMLNRNNKDEGLRTARRSPRRRH